MLPHLTRPVPWCGLVFGRSAVVASAEVSPASRDILLDLHVGIAEPNDDDLAGRILDIHLELLALTGSANDFVQGVLVVPVVLLLALLVVFLGLKEDI